MYLLYASSNCFSCKSVMLPFPYLFYLKNIFKKIKGKNPILNTLIQSNQVSKKSPDLQNLNYSTTRSGKREGKGEDEQTPQTKYM